ncbi:alpha/beta hydrolase family protein [Usitatibacter palustris]|uniref:Dienelactone hydrolase n=1 Tax=Usitatibacter palustris TaxID=2732487 RepID=A0A6M4HBS6_9PROT|nr:dienelactone hydrolase [Usitatibacter palustris]QJR16692.1 hypothetical protein DSM104440_03528 [Usitatibacter palustris]
MARPFLALVFALFASTAFAKYDPLAVAAGSASVPLELTVTYSDRTIPLRVYVPADTRPAPVVLFSHGLGGSREGNAFMGEHWAHRGYVAVFLQHPGSDSAVWKDVPRAQAMAAMKRAGNARNFMLRIEDVHATLDQLERWNVETGSPLRGRLELARVGMSGHSFGALTTQAVAGQSMPKAVKALDGRIRAVIVCSPSAPRRGETAKAFDGVAIPWLLMTGTHDTALIGDIPLSSRYAVYPALPPGGKYELVLDGAEHSAFTDRALPGDKEARNPNHHRAILALSTAFWDAYLLGDRAARAWLDGASVRGVLEPKDRWQRK